MASSSSSFSARSGVHDAPAPGKINVMVKVEGNRSMKPFEAVASHAATRIALANGWKRVHRWYKARQTYRALCRLDDRALKDIGVYRPDLRDHSRFQ
jgi:uncharacterized protein YjiS (DUF1127 family)